MTASDTTDAAALSRAWRGPGDAAYRGNALLAATAVVLLLAIPPSAIGLALDGRTFNGINPWIKPIKFQLSIAVHLLTIVWAALLLPEAVRRGLQMRVWAVVLAGVAVLEIGFITLRAMQGRASHYDLDSAVFGVNLYALMGLGATLLVVAPAWIGVMVLRHAAGPLALGVGLGFVLGGLMGGVTGALMSAQPGHWVGGAPTDAGGLPLTGWARDGGDLRAPHFFGLHLMQALPLTAFALIAVGARRWRAALIGAAAAGVAVTAATLWQALAGRPFL